METAGLPHRNGAGVWRHDSYRDHFNRETPGVPQSYFTNCPPSNGRRQRGCLPWSRVSQKTVY